MLFNPFNTNNSKPSTSIFIEILLLEKSKISSPYFINTSSPSLLSDIANPEV